MARTAVATKKQEPIAIGPQVTNGAQWAIKTTEPYSAIVELVGTVDLIFHRWNCESVAAKADSAKGSKAKKSDDVESYLYRDEDNQVCLPGEYVRQAVIHAAKFKQDPRSPRKSAMDLFKAAVVSMTPLAPLGTERYDYEHRSRVQVQRNGITRCRPAFREGWKATVELAIVLPEYVGPALLHDTLVSAGKLIGVGDNRPSYGRFNVAHFRIIELK